MKTIEAKEWYSASDIVRMRATRGSNENTRRQLLLRDIRNGDLKANNVGTEAQPRYVVKGSDLRKFIKKSNTKNNGTSNSTKRN